MDHTDQSGVPAPGNTEYIEALVEGSAGGGRGAISSSHRHNLEGRGLGQTDVSEVGPEAGWESAVWHMEKIFAKLETRLEKADWEERPVEQYSPDKGRPSRCTSWWRCWGRGGQR